MQIEVAEHTLLLPAAFETRFPAPLGAVPTPGDVPALLLPGGERTARLQRSEELRQAVRDMLRASGYKPTGRGKPASEYLVRAVDEGGMDSINVAVDIANAVSLHSGFPISAVDADLLTPPLRIDVPAEKLSYVFNRTGHEIDVKGLVCLFDATGPCANAVKDAQRTKTSESTRRTLSIVWGVKGHEAQLDTAVQWYRQLIELAGATTESVL